MLVAIAQCESHQQQFNAKGTVLRGKVNPDDIGYFQINSHYNGADAAARGFDIYTEKGNIGYALYLYHTQGTRPWLASVNCWGNLSPPAMGDIAER